MNKRFFSITISLIFILLTTFVGCNSAVSNRPQTETTTVIEETTAAETTVSETTVPETTAPEVTEPTKAEEPEKTENKPVNNNSSDKQQNNTNNNTQNTNKPSNNNGSQTTNNPSNNTSSGSNSSSSSTNKKPAETKPAEPKPVVVTDDTIIPYEQICTDTNMAKVTDSVNAYFIAKGMKYTPSLNKDNSGWFFVQMPMLQYDELSVNKLKYMVTDYFDSEVEAVLVGLGGVTDLSLGRFNCYYEVTPQGYYDIYFCYG